MQTGDSFGGRPATPGEQLAAWFIVAGLLIILLVA